MRQTNSRIERKSGRIETETINSETASRFTISAKYYKIINTVLQYSTAGCVSAGSERPDGRACETCTLQNQRKSRSVRIHRLQTFGFSDNLTGGKDLLLSGIIICILLLACAGAAVAAGRQRHRTAAAEARAEQLQQSEARVQAHCAELEKRIEISGLDRRDLYLLRVLDGNYYYTPEEQMQAGLEAGVEFSSPYYIVVEARPEVLPEQLTAGWMTRQDLQFILRNVLEDCLPGQVQAVAARGSVVAAAGLAEQPDPEMQEIIRTLKYGVEVLDAEFGLSVTVAVSRVYNSQMELHRAREDTSRILEYLDILGEDIPVTGWNQLTYPHTGVPSASWLDMESRLLECAKQQDYAGVQLVLHEMIDSEFQQMHPSVDVIRFRIYGVVNTLLFLLQELPDTIAPDFIDRVDPGPRLTSASTLYEVVETMDDILGQLVEATASQAAAPQWVAEMRQYVTENFRDPDLTVSSVAEHVHFTPTWCSRMFREQYGERLSDFIQQQRLDCARQLLPSGMTMEQIAESAGFSSALTMNRAFKRAEGVAPSVIRDRMSAGLRASAAGF